MATFPAASQNPRNWHVTDQWRIQGGPVPLFLAVNLFFYIVYNVWKNIFEIEFGFYSGRNPEFLEVWGCMCVWIEIVAATVFCSAKAQFWMISEAILIPKMYARLQKIASNFSKFSGGRPAPDPPPTLAPLALGSGLRPLTGPPFPKFLDPPLLTNEVDKLCSGGFRILKLGGWTGANCFRPLSSF